MKNTNTFNINNPIDLKNPSPNIDYRYGIYNSIEEALSYFPIVEGETIREIGRTVCIKEEDGSLVEYWFEKGIEDADLVRKNKYEVNHKHNISDIEGLKYALINKLPKEEAITGVDVEERGDVNILKIRKYGGAVLSTQFSVASGEGGAPSSFNMTTVRGHYYSDSFYADSGYTRPVLGDAYHLYLDVSTGNLYYYHDNEYKKVQ